MATTNPRCFFDVRIDGVLEGRLVFELFAKAVPKAAENFRSLCTGEKGGELHYKGSRFTLVRRGFLVEGGGLFGVDGGDISVYGGQFEEDLYHLRHSRVGMLSMVACGNNRFASKFCVVTNVCPEIDEKYLVFGKLVKGLEVLRRIELVGIDDEYSPLGDVTIMECGEIPPGGDDGTVNYFGDGDMFPSCPGDACLDSITLIISAVNSIISIAHKHWQNGDHTLAAKKCAKGKSYLEYCWEMSDLTDELTVELSKLKQLIDENEDACWKAMVQVADEVVSVEEKQEEDVYVIGDQQEVVDLLEEEGNATASEDDDNSGGDGSPDYDFHFRKGKAYISELPFQEFDSDTSMESKSGSKSGSGSSMSTDDSSDSSSGSGSGSGSDERAGSGSDGLRGPGLSRFGPGSSGSEDSS